MFLNWAIATLLWDTHAMIIGERIRAIREATARWLALLGEVLNRATKVFSMLQATQSEQESHGRD